MSDIFISYASEDRQKAQMLAEALERKGWSVWWDRKIPPGERYARVIEKELRAAKCVVVLWSRDSVSSDWVNDESADGKDRGILVPALIEDVDSKMIPLEFRRIQCARLVDWEGTSRHPEFDQLSQEVAARLGAPLAEVVSRDIGKNRVIIYIPGLFNQQQHDIFADSWENSIREGLQANCGIKNPSLNCDNVYWADLFYKDPLHQDEKFRFDKLFDAERYQRAQKGTLRRYEESLVEPTRPGTESFLKIPLDVRFQKVARDLDLYYDPGCRITGRGGQHKLARILLQQELERVIVANKMNTIMLIAHSMGSIIAYDVLRNLGRTKKGIEISHFVTNGSPLGLPHIRAKIGDERSYDHTEGRSVRTPSIVKHSWINFTDRNDPVAFVTHLRDDFGPNAEGVRVIDRLVINNYGHKGKINPHNQYGYLRTPEMSEHIKRFLGL